MTDVQKLADEIEVRTKLAAAAEARRICDEINAAVGVDSDAESIFLNGARYVVAWEKAESLHYKLADQYSQLGGDAVKELDDWLSSTESSKESFRRFCAARQQIPRIVASIDALVSRLERAKTRLTSSSDPRRVFGDLSKFNENLSELEEAFEKICSAQILKEAAE